MYIYSIYNIICILYLRTHFINEPNRIQEHNARNSVIEFRVRAEWESIISIPCSSYIRTEWESIMSTIFLILIIYEQRTEVFRNVCIIVRNLVT